MTVLNEHRFHSAEQTSTHIIRHELLTITSSASSASIRRKALARGLIYAVNGNGYVTALSDTAELQHFQLSSRQLLLLPPNSYITLSAEAMCTFLYLDFSMYSFTLGQESSKIRFSQDADPFPDCHIAKLTHQSTEEWLIQQIISETSAACHGCTVAIQKLTARLMHILKAMPPAEDSHNPAIEIHSLLSNPLDTRTPIRHVQNACAFVQSHIREKISLNDIAQHLAVTPSYLSGVFKKHMGTTLTAYILDQKLQYATELLATTSISIKALALELKFCDSQHFSKSFEKKYGLRPLAYRRYMKQTLLPKKRT